jgi:hypothetical protein
VTARSTDEIRADMDIDEVERIAAAATPGPWKVWAMEVLADPVGDSNLDTALPIARTTDPHRGLRTFNATFIAAARTYVPALIAEVRELRDSRERAIRWAVTLEGENAQLEAKLERVRRIAEADRLGLTTYGIDRDEIFAALTGSTE